jgi:hypothetical protein
MNGYLMQEQQWTPGQDLFIESFSPENQHGVVFEDDGDAAYFYAVKKDSAGTGLQVLDALHIFETRDLHDPRDHHDPDSDDRSTDPAAITAGRPSQLLIVWSKDWTKCALVIGGFCHAIFDFNTQAGYNINEFPPPNDFWTKGDRKMTKERIRNF